MKASDREQLLALMILDDKTGAVAVQSGGRWVVMLTGRFHGQYEFINDSLSTEFGIKVAAGISERIPHADLLRYYVDHVNHWTLKVMLDDYRNDALYRGSYGS